MSESGWAAHGLALSVVDFTFVDDFRSWVTGYEGEVSGVVTNVVAGLPQGSLAGFENRVKTLDSLARKVATDRFKDDSLSLPEVLAGTGDVLRYSIVVPEPAFATTTQRALLALHDRGCRLRSVRDGFVAGQNDYRGYNTKWRTAGQVPFEVQFHTPDSWRAGQGTHWIYEQLRLPRIDPKVEGKLKGARAEIYSAVPVPDGVKGIVTPDEYEDSLRIFRHHMPTPTAGRPRPPGMPHTRPSRRGLGRGG